MDTTNIKLLHLVDKVSRHSPLCIFFCFSGNLTCSKTDILLFAVTDKSQDVYDTSGELLPLSPDESVKVRKSVLADKLMQFEKVTELLQFRALR